MNIIELAREAGMNVVDDKYSLKPFLERFSQLVRNATLEEAKRVCINMQNGWASDDHLACADAIEALKEL